MKRRFLKKIPLTLLIFIGVFAAPARGDELQLISTIPVARDNTKIVNVASAGDFNNDGHGDLAVAIREPWPDFYEAVRLYWGGPALDSLPDLTLLAEEQPYFCSSDPSAALSGFGHSIRELGDIDGDGYYDLAVAAPGYCCGSYQDGRIYFYLGSRDPDSLPDVVTAAGRYQDALGQGLGSGDFDGDGLGDLLALCAGYYLGPRILIYLGGAPADAEPDWQYDYYPRRDVYAELAPGTADVNADTRDDFGWRHLSDSGAGAMLCLGADPVDSILPQDLPGHTLAFAGDVTLDGWADLFSWRAGWYICQGGPAFDTIPDHYAGSRLNIGAFRYSLGSGMILASDRYPYERRLEFFGLGLPFDTLPACTIDYGFTHGPGELAVGDLTGDGIDEIALNDSAGRWVGVYTIAPTDVADEPPAPDRNGSLIAYPNPFNTATVIEYIDPIGLPSHVELSIYNILGSKIRSYKINFVTGAAIRVCWDGTNEAGNPTPSGIYFARINSTTQTIAAKIVLLR